MENTIEIDGLKFIRIKSGFSCIGCFFYGKKPCTGIEFCTILNINYILIPEEL